MKIVALKTKTSKVSDFRHYEWDLIHPEHFGTKQDKTYWKKEKFIFKAEDKGQIVGVIQGDYLAGVMFIDQLIVKNDLRNQGIGKARMKKAEEIAVKAKLHKIYLYTGTDWKAVQFYKSLGYITEAKIVNYYQKKDFWIMSKELKQN